MSRIFNDYIVGAEREAAIEEATFNNTMAKLDTMYEMLCMKYDQMVRDAELKVFKESGTYDDLAFYMEEANNEVAGDKKNILQKIGDAIAAAFRAIIDGFKKLFGVSKAEPDAEVTVDSGILAGAKGLSEKTNGIIQSLNSGDIVKGLLGVAALVGTGFAVSKTGTGQKIKASVVNGYSTTLTKLSEVLSNFSEKLSTVQNGSEDEAKKNSGILNKLKGWLSTILGGLSGAFNKSAEKANSSNAEADAKAKDIAYKKAAAENGVTVTKINGKEYHVDKTTGKVTLFVNGSEEDVPADQIPSALIKLVNKVKGRAAVADQAKKNSADTTDDIKINSVSVSFPGIAGIFGKKIKNVIVDKRNGNAYTVDKNGELSLINTKAIADKINKNSNASPEEVQKYKKILGAIVNIRKNSVTKESDFSELIELSKNSDFEITFEEVDDVFAELMEEGYSISETEDSFVIREHDELREDYVESTSESIFGVDYEAEELAKEAANFEKELAELAELFSE